MTYSDRLRGLWLVSGVVQKNPRLRKIFVRNSGAGIGCANSYGRLENASVLQEKPMSIKFLVLAGGGGEFWVLGGGGECRFYFYGREDFSELWWDLRISVRQMPRNSRGSRIRLPEGGSLQNRWKPQEPRKLQLQDDMFETSPFRNTANFAAPAWGHH